MSSLFCLVCAATINNSEHDKRKLDDDGRRERVEENCLKMNLFNPFVASKRFNLIFFCSFYLRLRVMCEKHREIPQRMMTWETERRWGPFLCCVGWGRAEEFHEFVFTTSAQSQHKKDQVVCDLPFKSEKFNKLSALNEANSWSFCAEIVCVSYENIKLKLVDFTARIGCSTIMENRRNRAQWCVLPTPKNLTLIFR